MKHFSIIIIIFFYSFYEMAQNMVNNQNERKKLKSTMTECHKNCQVSVARDQKLTIESNLLFILNDY